MKIIAVSLLILLGGCASKTPVPVAVNPTPAPQPAPVVASRPKPSAALLPIAVAEVTAVEFSPDLRWLATGTVRRAALIDGTVAVRDCGTNRVVGSWKLDGGAKYLAFSSDGKMLAVMGSENKLSVWDWKQKKLLHHEVLDASRDGNVVNDRIWLAFSPDGRSLAVGFDGITLLETRQWKRRLKPLTDATAGGLSFSPNGRFLVAADGFEGYEGYTFIDLKTGKIRNTTGYIGGRPVLSPDGRMMAGGGYDLGKLDSVQGAHIWDTRTLKIKQTFPSESFQPESFSPDARLVAGTRLESNDAGPVEIWSVASGKRVRAFKQSAWRVVWRGSKTLLLGDETGVRRLKLP